MNTTAEIEVAMKPSPRFTHPTAELLTEYAHLAQIYVYYIGSKPCAIAYEGRAKKASAHHSFSSPEARENWIKRYTDAIQKDHDEKQARKEAIKAFVCPWQVGDILNYSWGWEQTNQDFYQIVEIKGKSVILQAIKTHSCGLTGNGMADNCIGVKDSFKDNSEPFRKLIQNNGQAASVKMDYGYADLWDGKPCYRSWYA